MPIGIDPKERCEINLHCIDGDQPERAVFICRYLTCKQTVRVEELRTEASKALDTTSENKLLDEAITLGITGWRGLKNEDGEELPFPDGLSEFTPAQKYMLIDEYPYRIRNAERQRWIDRNKE